MKQSTKHVLMVRPAAFGCNEVTAKDNAFQQTEQAEALASSAQELALQEFDNMVSKLKAAGVNVLVAFDTPEPRKPDAIFPNNWFTTHYDGRLILYPILGENRRWERRRGILELIGEVFEIDQEVDLTHYEAEGLFLEGTGSMILDKTNQVCYAALSNRTDHEPLERFNQLTDYEIVAFHTQDANGKAIYHTNVMMSVATHFIVVCLACITDPAEQALVRQKIENSGKALIDISLDQVANFCGNVLEVENERGELILVMSDRAYAAFTPAQKAVIERTDTILHVPIPTIEILGGGGTRCMLAEIYLNEKKSLHTAEPASVEVRA